MLFRSLFSAQSAKAWTGGLLAALAVLVQPLLDLFNSGEPLTWRNAASAVLAGLIALGAVYGVSNKPVPEPIEDEGV